MKTNPRSTISELKQITRGREEEHEGSAWDSKIHEPTGLTYEALRYKVWEATANGGKTEAELAEMYSVSESFVKKWYRIISAGHELAKAKKRYTLKHIAKSLTNRPKTMRSPVQDEIRDRVIERRRKYPFEGSKRIRIALGLSCSISVIDTVLRKAGLTEIRGKRKKPFYSRYESDRAMDMIQLDYKQWNDGTWSIFAVDDRSRFIAGLETTDSPTTDVAIRLVNGVIARFGRPKRILTDHGCQFTCNNKDGGVSRFDIFCRENGIEHVMGRVKHPQTQGKVERTHLTAKKEAPSFGSMDDPESARATLLAWIEYYNFERPHYALRHRTPFEVFVADLGYGMSGFVSEPERPKVLV